jgi:hypothetical protein
MPLKKNKRTDPKDKLKPEDTLSKYKSYSEEELLENLEAKYPNFEIQEEHVYRNMPVQKPKNVAPPKSFSAMPEVEQVEKRFQQDLADGGAIKVKKAVFGSLIRNMLHGKKTTTEDSAAPYRQTFNVKDSETGEIKNIMQDFKPIQSQNNLSNDTGLIGRLFGAIRNKPTQDVGPLKHDFYVKDKAGQNVNIAEKKAGGLVRQGYPKIAKKGWK